MADLQDLTCTHCGAALAGEAAIPGATIICTHCGTPFRVPETKQIGGVTLEEGSELVLHDGNIVGGNMIVGGEVMSSEASQLDEAKQAGGGVHIGSGAQITIMKGDIVGGDKIVVGKSSEDLEKIRAVILERMKQAQSVEASGTPAMPTEPVTPPISPAPPTSPATTPAPPAPPENFFKRWWRQLFN